jgi:hypothetical protein
MTFGLAPPKNVTNLFGNWLAGIDKRDVKQIRIGVCAIIWALWNARNDHVFNKPKAPSFLYVVLSPTIGAAGCHGFWVQLFGVGSTGYIQPIWLAA